MFEYSSWSLCCSDVLNEQEKEGLVSGVPLAFCWSIPYSVSLAHTREWAGDRPLGWKVMSSPTSNKPPLDDWYLGQSGSSYTPTQQSLPLSLSELRLLEYIEYSGCSAGLTWLIGTDKLPDWLDIGSRVKFNRMSVSLTRPEQSWCVRCQVCDGKAASHFFPSPSDWLSGVPQWNFTLLNDYSAFPPSRNVPCNTLSMAQV